MNQQSPSIVNNNETISRLVSFNPNNALISAQEEDHKVSKVQFEKLKVSEYVCCLLASIGVFCGVVSYDLTYIKEDYERAQQQADTLAVINSITTVCLLAAIVWRTTRQLRWAQAKGFYSHIDNLFTTGQIKLLVVELILNSVHPFYGIDTDHFKRWNKVKEFSIEYTYVGILSVIMLIRVYHLLRLLSIESSYRAPRSQRICKMNGAHAGSWFAIKCIIKAKPIESVAWAFCLGILTLGYSLRVFERPIDKFVGSDFANFGNCIWCIIITMTTVGYGDYFPVTWGGRFIGFIACIYGVLIVSLMVVTVTDTLSLDNSEDKSWLILNRLNFKNHMREAAANVIASAVRFKMLVKRQENDMLIPQLRKFRKAVYHFQQIRIKNIKLYNFDSFEDRVDSRLLGIVQAHDLIDKQFKECNEIFESLLEKQ